MPKITFRNVHKTFEVEKGISVLEAALRHGVPIYHTCGGNCSCSTCRVQVLAGAQNLTPVEIGEAEVLDHATNNLLKALKTDMLRKEGRVNLEKLRKDGYSDRFLAKLEGA